MIHQLRRSLWLRWSLLDRWLLRELVGPLLFFIALFTLLLLTGGVMFELVRQMVDKNLPIGIAIQVLLFSLPRWLVISTDGNIDGIVVRVYPVIGQQRALALRSLRVTTLR